mmetsp:Transcript_2687/g.9025  ORF Transcript_2687/g.9025 Transcript_2687/m.9025 type:complete len:444 (+) Transcript_2687:420-1751(+)
MKSRKRVKHDRNMRDYIPKQDEVIYQHPAKSSSLHFACQPLLHSRKSTSDGENKYPCNASFHERNDLLEQVKSDILKEDCSNSFLQAAKKELFEADFRNEIPKLEIEDSNLSAFSPIQHFNDMQKNPKRAKKKDLSFAISATSLQQEQRLKRQQEVLKAIGEGGVTEKTILGRLGDSRYTREILRRLLAQGIVNRCGKGGSNDPFLYSLNKEHFDEKGNVICSPDMIDPGLEVRLRRIEGKIKTFLDSQSGYITEKRIRIEVGDNTGTGKALRRLVITGVVEREGRGGIGDPYRYRRNPEQDGCETRRRIGSYASGPIVCESVADSDLNSSPTASNSSPGTLAVHQSNFICFAPPPMQEDHPYPMHGNETYRKEAMEGTNLGSNPNETSKCGLPSFNGDCLPDIHDSFDILNETGGADSDKARVSYSHPHWAVEVEKDFSSSM